MSIEGGPPDRLFTEYDDRKIRGQATGINGRLIDPAAQSTGLIARAGQAFNKLFHRTIDVTTEGAVYRINVKSARKFITNNEALFPNKFGKTSLSDKEIETCIHELRARQIALPKWTAIQSNLWKAKSKLVYEDLGTCFLFTTDVNSPQNALLTFQTKIEKQYALLSPEKRTDIDHAKLLQGDPKELEKLGNALYEEFKPGTKRGDYMVDLLSRDSIKDKKVVLDRVRAFCTLLETRWDDFCASKRELSEGIDKKVLLEKTLSGETTQALDAFKEFQNPTRRTPSPTEG
jgi:hypothetical protein